MGEELKNGPEPDLNSDPSIEVLAHYFKYLFHNLDYIARIGLLHPEEEHALKSAIQYAQDVEYQKHVPAYRAHLARLLRDDQKSFILDVNEALRREPGRIHQWILNAPSILALKPEQKELMVDALARVLMERDYIRQFWQGRR